MSLGLAPQLVEEIFAIVARLNTEENVGFLVAEQNTNIALRYADYGCRGAVKHRPAPQALPSQRFRLTLSWREMDSNFRFRAKGAPDLSFRFCLYP
jgi:hypothetical protein